MKLFNLIKRLFTRRYVDAEKTSKFQQAGIEVYF